ncbi:RDD family protein [Candidatus Amarobacter glycogenicus]|uniref:RDD family protein n=1 Tax=Candidatus Amarobacter glycogenicus TaxID=3140699 RepID=UPI003134F329|nr:RDD family protein [Dehalococcoidia bacterium]
MECGECGSSIRDEARVCLSCGEIVRRRVAAADRLQAIPAGVPHWIAFDDPRGAEVGFYGASRVQRILAGLIDALILGAIAFALSFVVGREAATLNSDGTVTFDCARIVPFVALGAIYHIAFPASAWQATPGKKFHRPPRHHPGTRTSHARPGDGPLGSPASLFLHRVPPGGDGRGPGMHRRPPRLSHPHGRRAFTLGRHGRYPGRGLKAGPPHCRSNSRLTV